MIEQTHTILVVDDSPTNIDIIKSVLSDDYLIQAAVSGKVALKIAEKRKPDLILLDVMMPEMDGYDVCRALKANSDTAEIPVMFVTGMVKESEENVGLSLGATGYVKKPINPEELKSKVADILS